MESVHRRLNSMYNSGEPQESQGETLKGETLMIFHNKKSYVPGWNINRLEHSGANCILLAQAASHNRSKLLGITTLGLESRQ